MRFAAVRARTGRFSRSCLAAGFDPGGFPRASTSYVCGAASDSTLRGELPTARCGPRITFVSSNRTTRKVDQVPNTEAFANLPQFGSGGRKETAQQSIPAEPLHPLMPGLGVAIQTLEDPGQLGRDRGLSLAKDPTAINVDRNRQQGFFIENCHALKPALEKAPWVLSCRLARRKNGSFKHFINQLRLCSLRARSRSTGD